MWNCSLSFFISVDQLNLSEDIMANLPMPILWHRGGRARSEGGRGGGGGVAQWVVKPFSDPFCPF